MQLALGALLLISLSSCLALSSSRPHDLHESHTTMRSDAATHFRAWVSNHAKSYVDDIEEMGRRLAIWTENLDYVINYNAMHTSHWLGMNSLADLTSDEYRKLLGYKHADKNLALKLKPSTSFKYANVDKSKIPPSVDWRSSGAVTPVKNQAQCGSCWAFSTTGSVEGVNAIFSGKLVSLSEQELVDCDKGQDNGCSGGLMDFAFGFIMENGGIDTEDDYPYTAADGVCLDPKRARHVVTIDGYEDVPANDEGALKAAVANQPVSVAIEADQKSFQLYSGGVFSDDSCGTELDHGVLVVGYGKDPIEGEYWIVKNSWGDVWGDEGYIRIKAAVTAPEGLCGIAMAASYPTKTSPNPLPSPDLPPPPPGPTGPGPTPAPGVICDDTAQCPVGSTCCCLTEIFGMCLSWGCCPMVEATCCEDNTHCCPKEIPVCDVAHGRCSLKAGSMLGSVPWSEKTPAIKRRSEGFFDRLWKKANSKSDEEN